MGVDRMFSRNERDEELRKLREELEELKEHLMKISGDSEAREPASDEPVRVPIKVSDEAEGLLEVGETEEAEAVASEARPSPRPRPWEEHEEGEDRRYRRRDYDYKFDFGERLGDYISGFVEDVMEGVGEEIEQSLFVHPRGRFVVNRIRKPRRAARADAKEAASVMSALGNEYRLKALDALSSGGLYASDFQEILGEISPSTLSSHLDVLEEAGLILQERRRGRYLITIPGRLAIKMSYQIARRSREDSPPEQAPSDA